MDGRLSIWQENWRPVLIRLCLTTTLFLEAKAAAAAAAAAVVVAVAVATVAEVAETIPRRKLANLAWSLESMTHRFFV